MAQLVIIRGTCNAGKTTTCWFVYQQLVSLSRTSMTHLSDVFSQAHPQHQVWFGHTHYYMRDVHPIGFTAQGNPCDFKALLNITNTKGELKKVAIISAGDDPDLLRNDIAIFEFMGAEVIVICIRTRGRSVTLISQLTSAFPSLTVARHRFSATKNRGSNATLYGNKHTLATSIVNYIQTII